MSKPMRRLIVAGAVYLVECAVLRDGITSPAAQALDDLKAGQLDPDTDRNDSDPWPDENQPSDYSKVIAMFKLLAEQGVPTHSSAINNLDDGIWEFKRSKKRFSFYDCDGAGGFEPKLRIRDRTESEYPNSEFWWLPDFDNFIRLGHFFVKSGDVAGDFNISETLRVRKEDLEHDGTVFDEVAI
jgi:hypothetical protein